MRGGSDFTSPSGVRKNDTLQGKVVGRDKTFWARGYCVGTVGLNEETIRRYVAEQEDGSRFE